MFVLIAAVAFQAAGSAISVDAKIRGMATHAEARHGQKHANRSIVTTDCYSHILFDYKHRYGLFPFSGY